MKNRSFFNPISATSAALFLLLSLALIPGQSMAQRFNHPTFSPPHPSSPASRPAPAPMPMPAQSRPAQTPSRSVVTQRPESRPTPPPATQDRPTINGGSRNFGNHDFNHTTFTPPGNPPRENNQQRENMQPRDNNQPHDNNQPRTNPNPHAVDPRGGRVDIRDHVNVYHTGNYHGMHPYYYHPYRPYYWGPHWHPLGFYLTALATDAMIISLNGSRYYYDDGCYYIPSSGGYSVVAAPVGAVVPSLPPGYETTQVGDDIYYYFGGVFYIDNGLGAFQVVTAPPGAVITQLPDGAVEQDVNGQTLLVYNNIYYLPISEDGQDAYEVVSPQ